VCLIGNCFSTSRADFVSLSFPHPCLLVLYTGPSPAPTRALAVRSPRSSSSNSPSPRGRMWRNTRTSARASTS
jgi:hypothetical protein